MILQYDCNGIGHGLLTILDYNGHIRIGSKKIPFLDPGADDPLCFNPCSFVGMEMRGLDL